MQYNLQNSLLTSLKIGGKSGFKKPSSWPDIRKSAMPNSIRLLADMRYPLGLIATATGGYSVDIDGEHYDDYNSAAQFSVADWADYTDTDGYNIDYPTGATKAHIIDIYPKTNGNNITAFKFAQVDTSADSESQGALWVHFNLSNAINLENMGSPYPYTYSNYLLTAVTAKNNVIDCGGSYVYATFNISALTYVPTIKNGRISALAFNSSSVEKVTLDSCHFGDNSNYCFYFNTKLEEVKLKNPTFATNGKFVYTFNQTMLKTFPSNWDWTNVVEAQDIWTDYDRTNNNGKPTVIDAKAATGLKILGIHDTNTLVGLRVSSSAPFNSETSPQIDVHNTALNRAALVQLFNDLPTVTGGQTINIAGCAGTADLTDDDKAIATNKGWTISE